MSEHPDMAEATRLQARYARRRRAYAKHNSGGGEANPARAGKGEGVAMTDMSWWVAIGLTFAASFVFIFLKAFQQRNVAFDQHVWILPTSMLMALVEVYVIANVAAKGFSIGLVLAIGVGSGLGALSAAITHKRMFAR